MNSGSYILSQVLDLVHRQTLDRLVERYDAESRVRHFGCRQQLICMAFAQLTWREGLREVRFFHEESALRLLEPLNSNQLMLSKL